MRKSDHLRFLLKLTMIDLVRKRTYYGTKRWPDYGHIHSNYLPSSALRASAEYSKASENI